MSVLGDAARAYATHPQIGWKVFPTWGIINGKCECGKGHATPKDMGKHPIGGHGQLDASVDMDVIAAHWPAPELMLPAEHNIGLPCGANGLLVIDVDPRNGGTESWARLCKELGGEPVTLTALTGRWGTERGKHLYFRVPEGAEFLGGHHEYPGIDIKHKGYVMVAPSRHGSGETYEWTEKGGPLARPPIVLPEALSKLFRKEKASGLSGGGPGVAETYGVLDVKGKKVDVDKLIAKGIPDGQRVDVLYPIMCSIANQYPVDTTHGAGAFRTTIRVINNRGCKPPLPEDELETQMRRAIEFVVANPKEKMAERELGPELMSWVAEQRAEKASPVVSSIEDLVKIADGLTSAPAAGAGSLSEIGATVVTGGPAAAGAGGGVGGLPPDWDDRPIPDGMDFLPRTLTDMGNARRLVDWHRGTVRHTTGMGWFVWDAEAKTWIQDVEGALAMDKATVLPALVGRELVLLDPGTDRAKDTIKWSQESRSTSKLKSAITQWQVRPEVRASVETWDSNRELLGVRNGVVNLRTGELLKGTPEQGITKRTDVAYEKGMRAVQWEQFLDFATGGDKELVSWLQLAAGYTLTGRNDYDVFFIVFGQPGSGKSTFLEALSHVLGEQYSIHLPVASLIDDGRAAAQDEYYRAQLPGKRMAVFSEWPTGKRTKEDAIKALTGDLTMTGRHPGGQPFTFQSQTKLWLGTNVTPAINDSAMWRRIRAIPFPHVPEKPDPDLKTWLSDPEGGLPAVMAWCVEGAVKLLGSSQRDALGWCTAVRDASAEYRAQEDRMGQFLEEECQAGSGRTVTVVALYETYKIWTEDRGEKPMTRLPFEKAMAERGIKIDGMGRHAVVEGLSLRPRVAGAGDGAGAVDIASLAERFAR